jgi:hypothetical protein
MLTQSSLARYITQHYPLQDNNKDTITVNLTPFPSARLITLPIPDLVVRPSSIEAVEAPILKEVYPRLQKPVPHYDSSTGDYVTGQPTYFTVLSTTDYSRQQEKFKKQMQQHLVRYANDPTQQDYQIGRTNYNNANVIIQPTDLYPITTALQIENKIDEAVWRDEETYDSMDIWSKCFKNYELMPTRGLWETHIVKQQYEMEWKGLRLFGVHHNALKPIVQLVNLVSTTQESSDKMDKLLFHAITIICWQFYSMERNRWLQIKLQPYQPFYERDIPSFFLFFLRYDIKKDPYPVPAEEWKQALQSNASLGDLARKYDFVTFFYAIMEHIRPILNEQYFKSANQQIRRNKVLEFIGGKLFNNFIQLLHTSHFWAPFIERFDEHCIDSVTAATKNEATFKGYGVNWMTMTLSKHFVSMKNNGWFKYDLGAKPQLNNTKDQPDKRNNQVSDAQMLQVRVPIPHCHFHFTAEQAIFVFPETVDDKPFKLLLTVTTNGEIQRQSKMQDMILNQLAKCMDQKTVGECRSALNSTYRTWIVNLKQPTISKRKVPIRKATTAIQAQQAISITTDKNNNNAVLATVEEEANKENIIPVLRKKRRLIPVTNKQKQTEEAEEEDVYERKVYHDPIEINLIRARYSFYIDREANTVATGVVPYLNWHKDSAIEPETSVNFIHPRVWHWLVQSGSSFDTRQLGLVLKHQYIPVAKTMKYFTVSETPEELPVYDFQDKVNQRWVVFSVHKPILGVHKYTMDYDAIQKYCKLLCKKHTDEPLNWYIFYYALIVLTRSERKAAYQITKDYCIYTGKELSCSIELCTEVLTLLQQDYTQLRETIKTKDYTFLCKHTSIRNMIEQAKNSWDRQSYTIISPPVWHNVFNSTYLQNYILQHSPPLKEYKIEQLKPNSNNEEYIEATAFLTEELQSIFELLLDHYTTGNTDPLVIPFKWGTLRISIPILNEAKDEIIAWGPALNLTQYNDYLISLFEPLFVKLSYFFQHMFPAAVIVDPCNKQHESLTQARNVGPHGLDVIYSLCKQIRHAEFITEVQNLINLKQVVEKQGQVFEVPPLLEMLYNIVLYQMDKMDTCLGRNTVYQTNLENCSEKDRGIEMLRKNLQGLCRDSTIFSINQQQIIHKSVRYLTNSLLFNTKSAEQAVYRIFNDLIPNFEPEQITKVMYQIIQQVFRSRNPIVLTRLQGFKSECLQLQAPPNYAVISHPDSMHVLKLGLRNILEQEQYKHRLQITDTSKQEATTSVDVQH